MSRDPARESLYKAWLEAHGGIIFKVTRSYSRSATEASDLRNELQLQLWNSASGFSGTSKESTWVYKVCLNTALAWRRDADRRQGKVEPGADLSKIPEKSDSPAESAQNNEILDRLYSSIQGMDTFDRGLVLMSLDGIPYRDIAEVTGLTETHVGVALMRARQRLTTLMKGIADELK
jgi:RNA polymerase sigma-70 factor (ECF subfamily)